MQFVFEKETKNYLFYVQVGGINRLYVPKPKDRNAEVPQSFTIVVPTFE